MIDKRIETTSNILLGRIKIQAQEDRTKIENLDEIKYSMNSILRKELEMLESIKNYPDETMKNLGIYTQIKDKK